MSSGPHGPIFYLLDYVTRRSEKMDFQKKRRKGFCDSLVKNAHLMHIYLYKSDLLNFYDLKNWKITIHMDTFCNSHFFPIADLKNFRLCNVIQQIKNSLA